MCEALGSVSSTASDSSGESVEALYTVPSPGRALLCGDKRLEKSHSNEHVSGAWWYVPVIPALEAEVGSHVRWQPGLQLIQRQLELCC